jgi:hybrid polyketide synthase/nonribosomal peptide synthetase ACE1
MGAELIESSSIARDIIRQLDSYLQEIEEESERPSWSLWEELLAQSTSSRVQEAVFSQPLCTAVQIMLVDILALANIRFAAVVGHSSGEIAAAYASGYISARDASKSTPSNNISSYAGA